MTLRLYGLAANTFCTGLDVWPSLGRWAEQTSKYIHIYGGTGLVIPFLASSDVFRLVEEILLREDDDVSLRFLDSQMQQSSMVAVTVGFLNQQDEIFLTAIRAP
jgi:UDP-N-acetyl-D-mannosaminuronic acid transferase (WecB/TagA/CpsF family)